MPGPSSSSENEQRVALEKSLNLNSAGFDDWGLHLETADRAMHRLGWLYHRYFRVEVQGIENVPEGRVLLVANHAGQLPFDGMLISMAMAFEASPKRIVRSMIERWFPSLPFVMSLFSRTGQVVGDPHNCRELLRAEQCVLAFPEGIRGSGKPYSQRYQLQRFGTGFLRLALDTRCPIVPVSVVGSEETYPAMFHLPLVSRLLGLPYFPITPLFPALGPLGVVPLPVKIQLIFGQPIHFDLEHDASDEAVEGAVDQVKQTITAGLQRALAHRPGLDLLARILNRVRR